MIVAVLLQIPAQVVTSDLGGEICQISLGGRRCQLLGRLEVKMLQKPSPRPSGTAACFLVPEDLDGAVDLHVAATNGNDFTKEVLGVSKMLCGDALVEGC